MAAAKATISATSAAASAEVFLSAVPPSRAELLNLLGQWAQEVPSATTAEVAALVVRVAPSGALAPEEILEALSRAAIYARERVERRFTAAFGRLEELEAALQAASNKVWGRAAEEEAVARWMEVGGALWGSPEGKRYARLAAAQAAWREGRKIATSRRAATPAGRYWLEYRPWNPDFPLLPWR